MLGTRNTTEVKYFVSVVGQMWLPQIPAAMEITITERDWNVTDADFENLTLEELEHWMYTHTGDLSTIDDYEISKLTVLPVKTNVDDDGWLEAIHRSKSEMMRAWENEESPHILWDCLYPIYD